MPKFKFGKGLSDWVFWVPDTDEERHPIVFLPGTVVTFWSAESSGAQYQVAMPTEGTDTLIEVSEIMIGLDGRIPEIDHVVSDSPVPLVWVQAGGGPRLMVVSFELLKYVYSGVDDLSAKMNDIDPVALVEDIESLEQRTDPLAWARYGVQERLSEVIAEISEHLRSPRPNEILFHGASTLGQTVDPSTRIEFNNIFVNVAAWSPVNPDRVVVWDPGFYQITFSVGFSGVTAGTYCNSSLVISDSILQSSMGISHRFDNGDLIAQPPLPVVARAEGPVFFGLGAGQNSGFPVSLLQERETWPQMTVTYLGPLGG